MLRLIIRDLTGKKMYVDASPDSLVRDLRTKISERCKFEGNEVVMFHQKRKLHGRNTLSHYSIKEGSQIIFVPKIPEKSFPKTNNAFHYGFRYEHLFARCDCSSVSRFCISIDGLSDLFEELDEEYIPQRDLEYDLLHIFFREFERRNNEIEAREDTIDRISELGYDRFLVIQVYESCDYDEVLTIACLESMES